MQNYVDKKISKNVVIGVEFDTKIWALGMALSFGQPGSWRLYFDIVIGPVEFYIGLM